MILYMTKQKKKFLISILLPASIVWISFSIALYFALWVFYGIEYQMFMMFFSFVATLPFLLWFVLSSFYKGKQIEMCSLLSDATKGNLNDNFSDYCDNKVIEIIKEIEYVAKNNQYLNNEIEKHLSFKQAFFKTMINGMVIHNKMDVTDVNQAICDMTGFDSQELKGMTLDQLIIPHETITGGQWSNDTRLFYRSMCSSKSGHTFPVDVQMRFVQTTGQQYQISVIRDLRERLEMEEELQTERERRTRALFDGQEMERSRLAKEIHDGLGQSLIAIRLLIEGKIAGSSEVNKEALEKIRTLIDQTISDARMMSNTLRPSVLHEFGFVTALRQLCDQVRSNSGLQVDFDVNCSKFVLNTIQTNYLFRIAQEALNNILKHSGATRMYVKVSQTESKLTLVVGDNGKGIDFKKGNTSGNGLYNIRERVQVLHGVMELNSNEEKGTELLIEIPNRRVIDYE